MSAKVKAAPHSTGQGAFEKWWLEHSGDYPKTVGGGEKLRAAIWQYFQREMTEQLARGHDAGFDAGLSYHQYEEHVKKHGHPQGSNCPNPDGDGLCGCKRDFPREAVTLILATIDCAYYAFPRDSSDKVINALERLFYGVEEMSLHEKTLAKIPNEIRERVSRETAAIAGVCPTCDGSGEEPVSLASIERE